MTTQTKIRNLDDFLALFPEKPRQRIKGGWNVICPTHDDRNPSLSVTLNTNQILLHCKSNAGCTNENIVKALGLTMADLFFDHSLPLERKITATYPYHDASGKTIYEVVRFEPKGFSQRRPDGKGGYIWDLKGITPVLYHLPDTLTAVKCGDTIYITEGEKDCDRLWNLGLVATTSPMGAGKWRAEYSEVLKGANIVVIADNDDPGREHASNVALSLYTKVKSLKVVQWNEGRDISDWMDKGHTIAELEALVKNTPSNLSKEEYEYIPNPEADNTNLMESDSIGDIFSFKWVGKRIRAEISVIKESLSGLSCEVVFRPLNSPKPYIRNIVNLLKASEKATFVKSLQAKREDIKCDELLEEATEEVIKKYREGEEAIDLDMVEAPQTSKYRLYPFIEEGEITTYYGAHETLKSYKMYYDAILIQNGLNIDGVRAEKGNVLILDFETHKFAGRERVRAIIKGLGKQGLKSPVYRKCSRPIPLDIINIQRLVLKHDIKVVFVDSVGISCGGDATSQDVMTSYYRALRSLGITVVTIDHEPRDANNIYGSVYKEIIARDVFETIRKDTEEDTIKLVIIKHTKTNNRSRIPLVSFKFEFDGDEDFTETVTVSREEAPEIATVFGNKEAKDTLIAFFKRTQNIPDSPKNIAVQTKLRPGTVRQTLNRWRGEVFQRLEDGRWKLVLLV